MIPSFYKEDLSGKVYLPRYDEISNEAEMAKKRYRTSLRKDNLLFTIDAQNAFCIPGASLYVPGAEQDNARLAAFIYRNMDEIDAIQNTLDTHVAYQIFFAGFWVDEQGNHPAPFTVIKGADIDTGKWRAVRDKRDTEIAAEYAHTLEEQGKYALIIWPYHTMKGASDHAVASILDEAYRYYEQCTDRPVLYKEKGQNTLTENYSAFSPEVEQVKLGNDRVILGQFDSGLMDTVLSYERIFIAGQASSHCVKATIEDIIRYAESGSIRWEELKRFYILEDCMSPVSAPGVDFPGIAQEALAKFRKVGMNIIKSTENI